MAKSNDVPKFGVLQGLNILSTGSVVAQPFGAALAADWGANVIQTEPPGRPDVMRTINPPFPGTGKLPGEGISTAWIQERRNERTIVLDLSVPEGQEVFFKLVKWADIWMESGKPGTYNKWGLSDEVVWKHNPKLVILHVSGFGQSGHPDYLGRASYDAVGQAFSGYMFINGLPEPNPPMRANPYTCDYITALFGLSASLAALYHAQETGEGESIDLAQYEAMMRIQCHYPGAYLNAGEIITRYGNADPKFAGYNAYQCKDGGWVFIGAVGGPFKRAMQVFGLADDPDVMGTGAPFGIPGTPGGDKVEKAISEYCNAHTASEVEAELSKHKVPCSKVNSIKDLADDPHVKARDMLIEWEDPAVKAKVPGAKVKGVGIVPKFKKNPGQVWRGSPAMGMDNENILESLGYSADQIKELYEKRVIEKK